MQIHHHSKYAYININATRRIISYKYTENKVTNKLLKNIYTFHNICLTIPNKWRVIKILLFKQWIKLFILFGSNLIHESMDNDLKLEFNSIHLK